MLAAVMLMIVSVVMMVLIVAFLAHVNGEVQRQQRERHFGDISHVRIPDDTSELTDRRQRPKPPYRPL